MSDETPNLGALQSELAEANKRLSDAELALARAQSVQTQERNNVNRLQRCIDETVAKLAKAAPRDTDWARNNALKQNGVR